MLAEPLLLGAVAWRHRQPTLRAAVAEIGRLHGVEDGWHAWLEHAWLEQTMDARLGDDGPVRHLAFGMDGGAATSVSLYAFRRRPWPVDLARIEIYESILAAVDPGSAAVWQAAEATVFRDELCGLYRPN